MPEVLPGQIKRVEGRAIWCACTCDSSLLFWLPKLKCGLGNADWCPNTSAPCWPEWGSLVHTAVSRLTHWVNLQVGWPYIHTLPHPVVAGEASSRSGQEGTTAALQIGQCTWTELLLHYPSGGRMQTMHSLASLILKSYLRSQRALAVSQSSIQSQSRSLNLNFSPSVPTPHPFSLSFGVQ